MTHAFLAYKILLVPQVTRLSLSSRVAFEQEIRSLRQHSGHEVTFLIEHKTDRRSVASDMGGCMGLAGDTGLGMGRTNLW
jgi:hypothetical protein